MGENQADTMQQLTAPRYTPRPQPTPIPTAAWNDEPLFCLQVNDQWVSHILGVLDALDQQDTWIGTEDDIFAARQQVNEIMNALMTRCTPPTFSFWDTQTPANIADFDNTPIELGLKFASVEAGNILGIKFYKASGNTGEHVGSLFASDGTLLASVTFTGETSEGWETAYFDTPVPIDAATLYVVAYHTITGNYGFDHGYFTAEFDRPPLYAPASGDVGGNGVYLYTDTPDTFPTDTASDTNYWVDVIFQSGT